MNLYKNLLYSLFTLLGLSNALSQSKEVNGGIQSYYVTGTYMDWDGKKYFLRSDLNLAYALTTIGMGWSLPVYNFNDDFTLGVLPSGNLGFGFAGSGFAFSAYVPAYLTLRYGAGANKKSKKTVGFGLNIGAQNNFLIFDEYLGPKDYGYFYFLAPEVGLELSFDFGYRSSSFFDNVKLRYSRQYRSKTLSFVADDGVEYNPIFRQNRLCFIIYTNFR